MKASLVYLIAVFTLGLTACSSYTWKALSAPFTPGESYSEEWKSIGKTSDGSEVFIHHGTVLQTSHDVIIVDAKTIVNGREYVDKLEFDCPRYKFRILQSRSSKKTQWRGIVRGSPSKLIHNAYCLDKLRTP